MVINGYNFTRIRVSDTPTLSPPPPQRHATAKSYNSLHGIRCQMQYFIWKVLLFIMLFLQLSNLFLVTKSRFPDIILDISSRISLKFAMLFPW